jgi:hypothetical protein
MISSVRIREMGKAMADDDQPDDEKRPPKSQAMTPYFGFAGTGAGGFNSAPFYSGQQISAGGAVIGRMGFNTATFNAAPTPIAASDGGQVRDTATATLLWEQKFAEMTERLAALEKSLASIAIPPASPGIGHNRSPEPIDGLPITPRKRRKLKASLAIVQAEIARPRRNPRKLLAAARALKPIAKSLLSFCKKQAASFVSKSVSAAALTAGPLWGIDIHNKISIDSIHEVGFRLLELIQSVEGWAASIRHLL